jgi:hypothetical protein
MDELRGADELRQNFFQCQLEANPLSTPLHISLDPTSAFPPNDP